MYISWEIYILVAVLMLLIWCYAYARFQEMMMAGGDLDEEMAIPLAS